jgi:hypothetical protein
VEARLTWARVQNLDGRFVSPGPAAFASAVEHGAWGVTGGRLSVTLTNPAGAGSWPITGASYILLRQEQKHARRAQKLLGFFHWALTRGGREAEALGYVTVPGRFVELIEASWRSQLRSEGKPLWTEARQPPPGGTKQAPRGDTKPPPPSGTRQPPPGGTKQAPRGDTKPPPPGGTRQPPPGGTKQAPRGDTKPSPPGGTKQPPPGGTKQAPRGDTKPPPPGGTKQPPPGGTKQPPPGGTRHERQGGR